MAFFRNLGEPFPARRFVVSVEPRIATGLAAEYLKTLAFAEHEWDMNSALASGVVETGWTGVLMAKGTNTQGCGSGCLLSALPFLAFFPYFRRMHAPLNVAIYARPAADRKGAELIFFYPNDDHQDDDTWDQKDYLIDAFEAFANVAQQANVYVSGPQRPDKKEVTTEHPASLPGWVKLKKVMKEEAKGKKPGGF